MEDEAIIDLYWQRNELAIEETRTKYGGYCYSIAYHLLHSPQEIQFSLMVNGLSAYF